MADREHDLVLLGATSFVGALTAEHLARAAAPGTRVALAGRDRERLAAVRRGLPAAAHDWPLVVVDVEDAAALRRVAGSTTALVTTVGPYARRGLPVVEACAAAGTHYADLSGELTFVRAAADATDARARATGARLVHACGYDSIPSDLGVLLLHRAAADDGDDDGGLADVQALVAARGGVSGGTVSSLLGEVEAVRSDPRARRLHADAHALSPDRAAEPGTPQPRLMTPPHRVAGRWAAPSVMAPFDAHVVRRSNALTGWAYGRGLRYAEHLDAGRGPAGLLRATALAGATALGAAALALPPTRTLVERALPAAGDGPDAATREAGWFRHRFLATTASSRRYAARVQASGDPGYAATAVMLGEAALALALDGARLPDRAGSLTPATALGDALVERLREQGFRLDAVRA
ncbi:saccharopine dehydrogenase family protein [Cellulomonas pakistanensis]|uniref:Trans-acting enoyl reductase n=1 Tax=Cellulomonas pakistanensis TaxID=992287 RepID=A0A919P8S3_9CELL|nr:saccharopine dehydrogenase NADP-binding domain-containing protein [Cellulomonas pakistanensis]GIG36464.1 putative trans-acting enoyl reductase [Cellulomonas pakistanensis]